MRRVVFRVEKRREKKRREEKRKEEKLNVLSDALLGLGPNINSGRCTE